jgi:SpoVK/Ycf46/Vps4 family AAA+-type ATPase
VIAHRGGMPDGAEGIQVADDNRRPRLLEVLGAEPPWEVPDDWLAGVRRRVRAWAEDPHTLRPGAFPDFVQGTPAAVWYAHQVAPLLGGWIPVLHGDLADISAALSRDFHRPAARLGGAGYVTRTATFDWPLTMIAGTRNFTEPGRRQALQLSREVMDLFVDAPPLAARAKTLSAVFDRVLADRELTRLHVGAPYQEIVAAWRGGLLHDDERAALPELAGAGPAVKHSLTGLRDAHADLSEVDGGDGDFAQVLARLILATGLDALPGYAAEHVSDAARDVQHALGAAKDGFDADAWLARNTSWLFRAVRQDKEVAARVWAAAATQVSVQFAGVLTQQPWPDPEVPDLAAFFRLLDRRRSPGIAADDPEPVSPPTLAEPVSPPATEPVSPPVTEPVSLPVSLAAQTPVTTAAAAADDNVEVAAEPVNFGDDPFAELEALIGLESVKEAVRRMVAETRTNLRRDELGLPTHDRARHMVFVGKPGTAKTTIARLLGRIYKQLGVLESGHMVEVDRSDLVGASVGATAPMTAAKFREALGGVLFVDEAYILVPPNSPSDYGHEAIATLLKMMEDHRDDCIVIVAGYHREMQRFMESNTGLASRFPKMLAFAEYNDDQLVAIFQLQARQAGMILSDDVLEAVRGVIPPAPRGHTFGNGRFIRNVLEEAISNQATRLSARVADELTERDLRELLPEDIKPPTSMRAEDYLLQQPAT